MVVRDLVLVRLVLLRIVARNGVVKVTIYDFDNALQDEVPDPEYLVVQAARQQSSQAFKVVVAESDMQIYVSQRRGSNINLSVFLLRSGWDLWKFLPRVSLTEVSREGCRCRTTELCPRVAPQWSSVHPSWWHAGRTGQRAGIFAGRL